MEQNSNEQTPTVETEQAEAAAPATKRAPRRATKKAAPAETSSETDVTPVEAPAAAEEAPAEKPKRVSRARKKTTEEAVTEAPVAEAPATESPDAPAAEEAPKKPATRRRRATAKTVDAEAASTETPSTEVPATEAPATEAPEAAAADAPVADAPAAEEAPRRRTRRATTTKAKAEAAPAADNAEAEAKATEIDAPATDGNEDAKEAAPKATTRSTRSRRTTAKQAEAAEDTSAEASTKQDESKDSSDNATKDGGSSDSADAPAQETSSRRTRSQRNRSRQQQSDSDHGNQQDAEQTSGDDKSQGSDADNNRQQNQQDQQQSRSRTRQRDRKRRGQQNEDLIDPELTEDDVLLPIAGILDVLDNYAFVRTTGYLPGPSDVYVSLGQVKRYNLRKGDAIVGSIRKPSEHDGGGRQKYNAIVKIDSVNGTPLAEDMKRIDFNDLTPLYPQERLRLETTPEKVTQRVIDLIAPIGKGQRGLIVAPPKAGKTIVLQQIANAVAENNPEAHLMVVLVDERPEEVTDMQRTVKGEVIASTFDRPAEDHTTVAELAIERAKRLVELGHDVVVLLDSITRLGRAYNLASPASGRVLTGGVDASALYPPKRFFGAARNIENGGSLTILATALVETGSKADEVIFEEFKGTGNMELRLSRQLADRRIFPAVNLNASSTRSEEMLLTPDEVKITWMLRRALGNLSEEQAAELVISKLRETQSNAEFLLLMQKSQGLS